MAANLRLAVVVSSLGVTATASADYWHSSDELSRCVPLRSAKQAPTHELCYESLPGAEGRRLFQIAIRDSSKLADQHHHALVTKIAVPVGHGEYMDFRRPSAFDLRGLQLIWAPIVHGTPSSFDRGFIAVFTYDPSRRRLKQLQTRLDCPVRCSSQFLSYQSVGGKVTLIHQSRVDGQSLRSTYTLSLAGGDGVLERIERRKSRAALARGRRAPPSTPVCRRTAQVRKEIERRLDFKPCKDVTAADLARISFLALRDRRIRRLKPGDFSGMPNLNRIDLSKNPLTDLPRGLFAGLFKLRTLSFQSCQLGSIGPRVFEDLGSLKSLYLNHNKIRRLHRDAFVGLAELTFLSLDHNELKSLPRGVFAPLKKLKRPYLRGNPLRRR